MGRHRRGRAKRRRKGGKGKPGAAASAASGAAASPEAAPGAVDDDVEADEENDRDATSIALGSQDEALLLATPDGRLDTFEPFISPARPHRGQTVLRTVIYVGIGVLVAVLVLVILNVMESRDLAPRIIPSP